MEKFKINGFYFFATLVLGGITLLNFFHFEFYLVFPFLPYFSLPAFAFVFIVLFMFTFWQREREFLELKYEFLTIATHKFRTALTGIKWLAGEFEHELTLEQKKDLINKIDNSIQKLMTVVDHLGGVDRADDRLSYAFKAVSLRELIDVSLQKFALSIREKKIHFSIQAEQNIPLIIADTQKIQFVIDTLFENAITYTPNEGSVGVALLVQKKHIVLAVSDTGIGLNSAEKRRLFRKFFRGEGARSADTEGLGLALFISKNIMKHHKGKLWVKSKGKNKGSTFFMMLNTAQ